MTYLEIYESALWDLEHNNITLGEFEEKIKPLNQEVRKIGHWEETEDYNSDVLYRCSECEEEFYLECGTPKDNEFNYCPKCGTKMEGE